MAINLTELAAALRLGDGVAEPTEPVKGVLTRLLAAAESLVDKYAPDVPAAIQDEAVTRLVGYTYDRPDSPRGSGYAAAWLNSGAASLVAPWRIHRVEGEGEGAVPGNPVVDITLDAHLLTVTYADGETVALALPAGTDGTGDDAATWAEAGNTDLIPAAKMRAANSNERGAVRAGTNAIIDTDSGATVLGWSLNHLRRMVQRIVPTWARIDSPSGHIPADRIGENPTPGTVPVVKADGRAFRFTEIGGEGGDPPAPTPPVVLVDAELFTAHGALTVPGWRSYDFIQMYHSNAGTTYSSVAISVSQLLINSPFAVPFGRNVALMLAIDAADDDVITTSVTTGNGVPAPTATSTITVVAWLAGTVADGGVR